MQLTCLSGSIEAQIGDKYSDHNGQWEVIGFPERYGEQNVTVRLLTGPLPSWFEEYANEDGSIDFCGDSVAACLLSEIDGRPRGSRGDLLTTTSRA